MIKKILISTLLLSYSILVAAQLKKLTLEDCVLKQRTTMAPEKLNQLQFIKDSPTYCWLKKEASGSEVWNFEMTRVNHLPYHLADLNRALRNDGIDTVKKWPTIKWLTDEIFQFDNGQRLLKISCYENKIISSTTVLPKEAETIDYSSKNYAAYTLKNNLYILKGDGTSIAISKDGNEGLVYGKSVHREEYGISKGTFWSDSGNKLAFYRMDQSMVADYPIMNLESVPAKVDEIKYPMAGGTSHQVTIGIYNLVTGQTVYLKTGEPKDQYLTNIAWSPDESAVFVAVLNRATNHMWMNEYDAESGNLIKTLFEEQNEDWVEPLTPIQFLKNDASRCIWQSQRTGHNQLYIYDFATNELRQLTFGTNDVIEVVGMSRKPGKIYYTATLNLALEKHLFEVSIKDGATQELTTGSGTHSIIFNEFNESFIDNYSNLNTPRVINFCDKQGRVLKTELNASNPFTDYEFPSCKLFQLQSSLGDLLNCRLLLPPKFDSTKKYPSITYVYNGPHVQLVSNSWLGGADLFLYYLAQEGFVVFTMDGHGSGNRGFDFEKGIHRQLGKIEIEDQIRGHTFLTSLGYIDRNRMGVHGWSYGGFMTTSLMTRTPGKYKVGVCGGPVIDWSYYEVMYTERYMDTPQENPDGYKTNSLFNYVNQLQGKLLMIHGTSDNVVVWQHSLAYLKKCVESGKQIDYFVYPGHEHNVLGKDRIHLEQKIYDYFKQNL